MKNTLSFETNPGRIPGSVVNNASSTDARRASHMTGKANGIGELSEKEQVFLALREGQRELRACGLGPLADRFQELWDLTWGDEDVEYKNPELLEMQPGNIRGCVELLKQTAWLPKPSIIQMDDGSLRCTWRTKGMRIRADINLNGYVDYGSNTIQRGTLNEIHTGEGTPAEAAKEFKALRVEDAREPKFWIEVSRMERMQAEMARAG